MRKIPAQDNALSKMFILWLCLFCFVVYFNSFSNGFVLDDKALIVKSPFIKSFKMLPLVFRKGIYEYSSMTEQFYRQMYRPLQILTYGIDYKIWKLKPSGFHLSNTAIHLINSVLVYCLLFQLTADNNLSKITSALFLAHPINTSVVSYISGRADLLAYMFMLLSIISFLAFYKLKLKPYYALSLLCGVLALLSRENALLLFIFIMLILFFNKAKIGKYIYVAPFILLNLFYIALRFFVFGHYAVSLPSGQLTWHLRLINFLNIAKEYALLLILPLDLRLFRSTLFIKRFLDIRVFVCAVLIVLLIMAVIKLRKNRLVLFSALWFFIGLIPVFMIMDIYDNSKEALMAESWIYVSSLGVFIAIVIALFKLKRAGKILIIAMLPFYSFLTVINNLYWENDYVLHKNMLEYTSEREYLRINLFNYYMNYKLYEQALGEVKKYSVSYPDTAHTYFLWGNYYFGTGEFARAVENYNNVLAMDQKFFYARYNLSLCYENLGRHDEAVNSALACFRMNPYYVPNLILLGNLYSKRKQFAEAKKYFGKALEVEPDNQRVKEQWSINR